MEGTLLAMVIWTWRFTVNGWIIFKHLTFKIHSSRPDWYLLGCDVIYWSLIGSLWSRDQRSTDAEVERPHGDITVSYFSSNTIKQPIWIFDFLTSCVSSLSSLTFQWSLHPPTLRRPWRHWFIIRIFRWVYWTSCEWQTPGCVLPSPGCRCDVRSPATYLWKVMSTATSTGQCWNLPRFTSDVSWYIYFFIKL